MIYPPYIFFLSVIYPPYIFFFFFSMIYSTWFFFFFQYDIFTIHFCLLFSVWYIHLVLFSFLVPPSVGDSMDKCGALVFSDWRQQRLNAYSGPAATGPAVAGLVLGTLIALAFFFWDRRLRQKADIAVPGSRFQRFWSLRDTVCGYWPQLSQKGGACHCMVGYGRSREVLGIAIPSHCSWHVAFYKELVLCFDLWYMNDLENNAQTLPTMAHHRPFGSTCISPFQVLLLPVGKQVHKRFVISGTCLSAVF